MDRCLTTKELSILTALHGTFTDYLSPHQGEGEASLATCLPSSAAKGKVVQGWREMEGKMGKEEHIKPQLPKPLAVLIEKK